MSTPNQLIKLYSAGLALIFGSTSLNAIQLPHTQSPSRGLVGGKLTYIYSLENDGAADESGTLFTNTLPPNSVFVSAMVTNGAFTVSNNVFSFRPGQLSAGRATTVEVVVTPVNTFDLTNTGCWVSSTGAAAYLLSVAPVDSARPGPQLVFGRSYHTSTLLGDGRVLVTGGQTRTSPIDLFFTKAAEVYTPANNSFSLIEEMTAPRAYHTATRLNNGMVIIAGGTVRSDGNQASPETAELFDPVSNAFSIIATSMVNRAQHTATLLPNGDVILAGGAGTNTVIERLHSQDVVCAELLV